MRRALVGLLVVAAPALVSAQVSRSDFARGVEVLRMEILGV